MVSDISYIISVFLFAFVFAGILIKFIMLALSMAWIRYEKKLISLPVQSYPRVSVLIPAYNEESTIVESVTHVINSDYPDLEVVVINDGSKDKTLELLCRDFLLQPDDSRTAMESIPTKAIRTIYTNPEIPNLMVVDKENGGKADALNCGINAASGKYVLALDADTHLTANTIYYLVRPCIHDQNIAVTSGSVRIVQEKGVRSVFVDLQKAEFVNSISLFRTGWNYMNANLIVSGALGLFDRKLLLEINGYHNLAIGEDMELIVRIHRHLINKKAPYKVLQFALPTCFTSAVYTVKEMVKQRKRWQKGLLSTLRLNRKLFFNPKYGKIGLIALPYYILFEVVAPFLELFGLFFYMVVLVFGTKTFTLPIVKTAGMWTPLWIWLAGLVFAIFTDWLSITIDRFFLRGMSFKEYLRLLISSLTSPFFYHFIQLYCKIRGTTEYFSTIQTTTKWDTERKTKDPA